MNAAEGKLKRQMRIARSAKWFTVVSVQLTTTIGCWLCRTPRQSYRRKCGTGPWRWIPRRNSEWSLWSRVNRQSRPMGQAGRASDRCTAGQSIITMTGDDMLRLSTPQQTYAIHRCVGILYRELLRSSLSSIYKVAVLVWLLLVLLLVLLCRFTGVVLGENLRLRQITRQCALMLLTFGLIRLSDSLGKIRSRSQAMSSESKIVRASYAPKHESELLRAVITIAHLAQQTPSRIGPRTPEPACRPLTMPLLQQRPSWKLHLYRQHIWRTEPGQLHHKKMLITAHQLVGHISVVFPGHSLSDSRLHETRKRREDVDRRVDLTVAQLAIDVDLALCIPE